MASESARLAFITEHFERLIPTIEGIELTRDKVRQNGHFRVLPGVEFNFDE
jgi:hypothetical protein